MNVPIRDGSKGKKGGAKLGLCRQKQQDDCGSGAEEPISPGLAGALQNTESGEP